MLVLLVLFNFALGLFCGLMFGQGMRSRDRARFYAAATAALEKAPDSQQAAAGLQNLRILTELKVPRRTTLFTDTLTLGQETPDVPDCDSPRP